MRESSENIMRAIELSRQLLYCADLGELLCEDKRCGIFYKIVRRSANKIMGEAEKEREHHMNRGIWEKNSAPARKTADAKGKKNRFKYLSHKAAQV